MVHSFRNAGAAIPILTTATDVYICPPATQATIHAIILTNIDQDDNSVVGNVQVHDVSALADALIINTKSIPVGDTFSFITPINLEAGDKLQVFADDVDNVSCFVSVLEIS